LLVSVRNAAEAVEALAGGANIIDVKEPLNGPLGAADWLSIAAVLDIVDGQTPVSAALGELCQWSTTAPLSIAKRLHYVKFGLGGAADFNWSTKFSDVIAAFPREVMVVPVAYADHEAANGPTPSETLHEAGHLGCPLTLIDTFDKQSPTTVPRWSAVELQQMADEAGAAGTQLALAGSVRLEDIEWLADFRPAIIGVRGAACVGGRLGTVDRGLVRRLRDALDRVAR
jgi:uncharacterized protein (UPF0264 family)